MEYLYMIYLDVCKGLLGAIIFFILFYIGWKILGPWITNELRK